MRNSEKTDEQLLAEFVAGRRAALGELARRHEAPLLGLACGLLGGREDLARDAVQETWMRVVRFAGGFHGRSGFKTWVYRIAVNQCRNIARLMAGETPGDDAEMQASSARRREVRPEQAARNAERNTQLRLAVAALCCEKQEILLLCYHEAMTHEQAAEVLNIPLGTVKSRLSAALAELRRTLDADLKEM